MDVACLGLVDCSALKLPPESTGRAAVYGLIHPYDQDAAHFHCPSVLTLDLQVLFLAIADDAFPSLFFLRFPTPAGNDGQMAPVVYGVPAVLVQL